MQKSTQFRSETIETDRKLRVQQALQDGRISRVGIDSGAGSQASSYLAIHLFGDCLPQMLRELLPDADFVCIEEWIANLGAVKTGAELERITGFQTDANSLSIGSAKLLSQNAVRAAG